jgi:hypothetical protein
MYSSYEEIQVPSFTECHFVMPISAITRCNLQGKSRTPVKNGSDNMDLFLLYGITS